MEPTEQLVVQVGGRGRAEDHADGGIRGLRFEGRFVILGIDDSDGPLFGPNRSLFDDELSKKRGPGPHSAHLVAVRSGSVLEAFNTDEGDGFIGLSHARSTSDTRLRIYFDAVPDGSRHFDDRDSFMRGELVGMYAADEYIQTDPQAGTFTTRVNYSLLSSIPFSFQGRTVDFGRFPSMVEVSHGRSGVVADPEAIPDEPHFGQRRGGVFVHRFAVGGAIVATTRARRT